MPHSPIAAASLALCRRCRFIIPLAGAASLSVAAAGYSDEVDARDLLQRMSSYLESEASFGFDFDEYHEVVTTDGERLGLASSGRVAVTRPDRLMVERTTGFTETGVTFDGQLLSVFDEASGLSAEVVLAGDIDDLVDTLRNDFGRPLPAADLLANAPHDGLMETVTEVKDLGAGVVSGVVCDHLALRAEDVDWQIWIARGDTPYPCMLVITTRDVEHLPQYRVTVSEWRSGDGEVTAPDVAADTTPVSIDRFLDGARVFPDNYSLEPQK